MLAFIIRPASLVQSQRRPHLFPWGREYNISLSSKLLPFRLALSGKGFPPPLNCVPIFQPIQVPLLCSQIHATKDICLRHFFSFLVCTWAYALSSWKSLPKTTVKLTHTQWLAHPVLIPLLKHLLFIKKKKLSSWKGAVTHFANSYMQFIPTLQRKDVKLWNLFKTAKAMQSNSAEEIRCY